MKIHRILQNSISTQSDLGKQIFKAASENSSALWFSKQDFFHFLRNKWIRPSDWTEKIFLESAWSEPFIEKNKITSDLMAQWNLEEVLVSNGTESDLENWRDLSRSTPVPLYLLIRPASDFNGTFFGEMMVGQDDGGIYFETIPPNFNTEDLPRTFRVKPFPGLIDRKAAPLQLVADT